jgi:hypothetical protein
MVTVVLSVVPAGLGVVMVGVARMAVGAVGVVRRLVVVAGLVVLGCFAVMLCGMLVMFGRLVMMINACVVAHVALPVWRLKFGILTLDR